MSAKFLIQTIDGRVKSDFGFALMEAIEYHQWLGCNIQYELSSTPEPMGMVPVGTLEFVLEYMRRFYGRTPKPLNVPPELQPYAGRRFYQKGDVLPANVFAKSADHFKSFTGICGKDNIPADLNLQLSDVIEIESEWRAFVFQGKLRGLQYYSGDFTLFPDVDEVERMIAAFKSAPAAYTLDVGIYAGNAFVIEVHDFFSCGLYGFNDKSILPAMFSQWWHRWERQQSTPQLDQTAPSVPPSSRGDD